MAKQRAGSALRRSSAAIGLPLDGSSARGRPTPAAAPDAPVASPRRRSGARRISKRSRSTSAASRRCSATTTTGASSLLRIGPAAVSRGEGAARARAALPEHLPAPGRRRAKPRRRRSTNGCTPSTLAINGGRYDEAISHLRLVRDEDPDNDHALYMLAVAHAQRGEHAEADRAPRTRHRAQSREPRPRPARSRPRAAARRRAFRAALETPPRSGAPPPADRSRPPD